MATTIGDREVSDLLARALCGEPNRKHVVPVGAAVLENLRLQEQAFGTLLATLLLPRNRTKLEAGDKAAIDDLIRLADDYYRNFKARGGEWSLDECLSDGMKNEVARLNAHTALAKAKEVGNG